MQLKENDIVKFNKDYYKKGVKKGDIGCIVMVFNKPKEAYEVEFINKDGSTKIQCIFSPNELKKI